MKLTDAKLRTLTQPGRYFDGGGLYLEVTAAGGRYWRAKYRAGGKEKRLAFGVYPAVGLKAAREKLAEARAQLQAGHDPGQVRKEAKVRAKYAAATTLEAVAREWLKHQAGKWATVTLGRITASLEAYVFPKLGARCVAEIRPGELRDLVKAVEARGANEQAERVLQRVKAIYRYAATHGRIETNPMSDLMPGELLKPRQVQHRPALADGELPEFLERFAAYQGDPHTVNALRLLMLTAVRPGEVRGARWAEFELDAALWRIPAERMKMRDEHLVPLSTQALGVLRTMEALSGTRDLVFPSPFYPSKPLSENTLNGAMVRMGYKGAATAHGFRSLFSTVANEQGWRPDVIERQLAHVERNQVRAAYNRAAYLPERAKLLQWWADYLDGRKHGNVVKLPRRAA